MSLSMLKYLANPLAPFDIYMTLGANTRCFRQQGQTTKETCHEILLLN
jgi:hypothetical protein